MINYLSITISPKSTLISNFISKKPDTLQTKKILIVSILIEQDLFKDSFFLMVVVVPYIKYIVT